MIQGKDKSLTAKNILSLVSAYDIYRFYINYDFKLRKLYPSPFRHEAKGSFSIMCTEYGRLRHIDFGNSSYSGNCFQFVQQLFNLGYNEALNKINYDMNLGLISTIRGTKSSTNLEDILKNHNSPDIIHKSRANISVQARNFTKEDIEYWSSYGITEDELIEEKIYSVDQLYINGTLISPSDDTKEENLRFAYLFISEDNKKYIKIYSPLSKKYKWISNVPPKEIIGLSELPKISKSIIIAKSKKDKIVLKKIHTDVYEVQKEGTECIPPELDSFFDEFYENKFCFFDNDEPGKTANKLLNPLGYGWINIPNHFREFGIKDPSDLIQYYGIEKGYEILRKLLVQKGITPIISRE